MDEKKKQIALDITTQIVVAKMSNSSIRMYAILFLQN